MPQTIYNVQDRGFMYIYHWICYIIAGFRRIPETGTSTLIHMAYHDKLFDYQLEMLDLIKDKYVITRPAIGDNLINHFGEPRAKNDTVADHTDDEAYKFLRSLYLERVPLRPYDGGMYYITRKGADKLVQNAGRVNRQILNEAEIYPDLEALGIKIIQLETLTFTEKVQLFNSARLIIGPNSGGLTCSLWANEETTVVEITPEISGQHKADHYKYICQGLGIKYYKYTNVRTVGDNPPQLLNTWNMYIDKVHFINFIKGLIN